MSRVNTDYWLFSVGLTLLRGPYELTITQCIGALIAGFDPAGFWPVNAVRLSFRLCPNAEQKCDGGNNP